MITNILMSIRPGSNVTKGLTLTVFSVGLAGSINLGPLVCYLALQVMWFIALLGWELLRVKGYSLPHRRLA